MKKVFLTLVMLLFAFTGVTRANVQQNRADQVIEQGFEDGLGDWTMNHCHSSSGPTSSYGGNTGNYAFRFYYTANYPQYLISPELDDNDGVNLTFYAARYSSSYPETFKVGYSSTTNDPTEFTWGSEVTCTTMYGAGAYQEYSYDFPAGTKYVSIACTSNDQFYMFVDDITVTATEPAPAPTPGGIVEVTIGDPTSTTTNSYLPGYTLYDYAISQQIYTADEIGVAGTINTLTVWLKNSSSYARNINVYMKEVEATEFASNTAWETFAAADMVASFTMPNDNSTPIEVALDLSTPFEYSGNDNLMICFQDVTGQWSSGLGGVEMAANGNQSLYAYRDGTVYDPSNVGVSGTLLAKKNVIRLSIMTGGDAPTTALSTDPEVLALGYRPNGAWMAPYVFNIKSNVGAVTVNALDFSGDYFNYEAELPASIGGNNKFDVTVTTGTAEAGEVSSTITVLYGANRDAEQFEITATAYDPVDGDVWETAIEVPAMEPRTPYESELPEMLYKNYELPDGTENTDAVYKMTFDQDVLLYAGASSANASAYLYTEGFEQVGGPAAENYYEYNGPEVAPGPKDMWFSYPYTGTNTWYGTSAGGGFYFGYKISTAVIEANELAGLTITTVEAAAREAYPYYCYIIEGGATPFDGDLIGMGGIENPEALYFFDINLEEPVYISGNEDIWVIFYSDSPYAAYCGRYPVDTNNGKIWTYNPNASSPMWSSNTTYAPVIYCRMLELPTGREVNMNLANMEMPKGNGVVSEVAEAEGNVMNAAKAQLRNRAVETLTVHDGSATNGNVPVYGFYADAYLKCEMVYPAAELADMNGAEISSMTFYASQESVSWGSPNFQVFVAEVADASISEFAGPGTVVYEGALSIVNNQMVVNFTTPYEYNGGNLLVGFYLTNNATYVTSTWLGETVDGASVQGYSYSSLSDITAGQKDFLPKTTFAYEVAGGGTPEPPTPVYEPWECPFTCQIDGMFVPAGTYYLVFASDVVRDVVNIGFSEIPAPEQATILYPQDGETNVEYPYIAEWILGDYTEEMQVLLGTQYPPQTVLIDWTPELVAGAVLPELEPNQSYFMQVNERNAAGVTEGEIIAFTTPIDPVEGFEVAEANLYPGDAAEFSWTANRSLKGYNLYQDGVKVNETPITAAEYAVEGLEYNMAGYAFQVSAVYDAGESELSEAIIVKMTGTGTVSGHVYDTDEEHPVANIPVSLIVLDEYQQTQQFTATTDENGFYTAEVLAGMCVVGIIQEDAEAYGYAVAIYLEPGTNTPYVMVDYQGVYENIDIITHEYYYPLSMITATEQVDENNVLVEWSWTPAEMIVDFETGDFSQAEFTLPAQYPWTVTTTSPYEGTYCMKSTCEGVASGVSSIEATVEVPYDGKMGFYVKTSTEASYDKFSFYIDGVMQGSELSGANAYTYKEYNVTAGTHTYKWMYAKDSSVNSNDDCVYVDNITMYKQVQPTPPPAPGDVVVKLTAPDIWGDGTGYQMLLDDTHSLYGSVIPETGALSTACSGNEGIYDQFSYKIPTNADGSCSTSNIVYMSTVEITIPSGIYDWCITNPTPGDRIWIAAANGNVGGRQDDYVFEGGHTYEFTVSMYGTNDGVDVTITGGKGVVTNNYADRDNCNSNTNTNANVDCKVADPEMLANRVVGPIPSSRPAFSGDRSLQSFNLYRRNNIDEASVAEPELIAEGINADVFEYIDNDWATLPYGEWQWGIQATYDGYAVEPEPEYVRDVTADDCGTHTVAGTARDMWDYVYSFDAAEGGHYGVAYDGENFYTSNWGYSSAAHNFYKYDLQGNMIEGFEISGCGTLRGMTYDGEYFYGVANASTIYCVDLANHTLVSTISSAYGAMRGITYDPERDGFWVIGNWSGNLTLINRSGAVVTTGPAPTSASDLAYYKDPDGVEHVFCFNNGTNDVDDYNIATNTITTAVFNFSSCPGYDAGSSGGCTVGVYNDKTCFIGDIQQSPNLIGIYELDNATPAPPTPPTPPTPGPVGAGLSEILWSNVLEKDMEATLTFNVGLNNAQDPDGAVVTIVGENNNYNATIANGTAEVVVRKGDTYDITVALEGYNDWNPDGNPILVEADATYDILLQEIVAPLDSLYVSPTGWAMWEGLDFNGGGSTPVTPPSGNTTFTEGFEGGLNGWNVLKINADGGEWIHSDANLGGYTYTTLAHGGTGFAMCYSYVDYMGAYNTDSYMYTPQKYSIVNGSTLHFFADNANDDYPENFSVCVSTAATPASAADFTQVWSGGAKGSGNGSAAMRHIDGRYENWREHTIDLSAYAGQDVWIAFHDVNYDAYEIWIDDVELTAGRGDRAPISYKVMLDGVYEGETYNMFYQHNTDGMEEGSTHVTAVAPLYASGLGDWVEYTWTYTDCSHFNGVTEFNAEAGDNGTVNLNWTLPGGGVTPPGGATTFEEGFEGGMPEGWTVVDGNNDGYTWCLTSAIPTTWTYYASLTLDWYRTGTNAICSGSYINGAGALNPDEYLNMGQVNIANGSTLSFYAAATDASYPAEHFGVFVSDDGTNWTSVQEWTLSAKGGAGQGGAESRNGDGAKLGSWHNYTVDLSDYAGQKYLAIRHFNCYDQYIMVVDDITLGTGTKGSRDMWDYVYSFNAAEGGHYGVAYDGENFYTSNWGYSSAAHNFYKYDLQGNMIEGFEISGCGTLRGMTYDGEYFYGVANASTIYCVDLANHTLVSTISSAYGAMRGITYDPERDGFWVIGNWSGNLTLIDRTGAIQITGPAPTSASDLAYYKDPDGVEHVFCFNNGTNDVDDYNIATNTITTAVFNFSSCPGYDAGSSGGCTVGVYDGKTCFIGDIQQSPNLIGIYELDASAPVPPITPTEGILGVVLFRDGEYVDFFPAGTTSYTDYTANEDGGEYTYTIRVVYGGEPDVTLWAMSCGDVVNVTVQPWGIGEVSVNTLVYPNPTNGTVTIEAQGMTHITVANTLGQVVYDADVNADMTQLNLGQFNAGLYLIRINTEAGMTVERVTVVK